MRTIAISTLVAASMFLAAPAHAGRADKAAISHMMVTPANAGTKVSVTVGRLMIWTDDPVTVGILMDAYVSGKPVSALYNDNTKKIAQLYVHKN